MTANIQDDFSVFIEEGSNYYVYRTIFGNVTFRVPKNEQFDPVQNGGLVLNSMVIQYILDSLISLDI
jgi:hypothetical protein